jgi:hypothetical protein
LFAPALAQAGLSSDRVIYLEAGDDKTVLACAEEGLRHGGLGAVVAEVARLSMIASRRLLVRAAMPAEKSAAAAPSMAPLPPPATSCSAPRTSPPLGSRESNSAIPKGSTDLARRLRPSIFSTCARRDSMAVTSRTFRFDLSE